MKTTIQQQIKAVQDARHIISRLIFFANGKSYVGYTTDELGEIKKVLNDAGGTLMAINLNPEIKKLLEP